MNEERDGREPCADAKNPPTHGEAWRSAADYLRGFPETEAWFLLNAPFSKSDPFTGYITTKFVHGFSAEHLDLQDMTSDEARTISHLCEKHCENAKKRRKIARVRRMLQAEA